MFQCNQHMIHIIQEYIAYIILGSLFITPHLLIPLQWIKAILGTQKHVTLAVDENNISVTPFSSEDSDTTGTFSSNAFHMYVA